VARPGFKKNVVDFSDLSSRFSLPLVAFLVRGPFYIITHETAEPVINYHLEISDFLKIET